MDILRPFLLDPLVSELMFNSFDRFFIERDGKIEVASSPFASEEQYEDSLSKLIQLKSSQATGAVDYDGILADGSRFHITRPPLSPLASTLTVRKYGTTYRGLEKLVTAGFLTAKCARFLDACVQGRINIVISGATGAGKTTLMNSLCSKISTSERIITVEDIPEMQLNHPNWVRLVSVRTEKGLSTAQCLVSSVRMRPDRIIVGECRSDEVIPMLQAMNTGHDGSMTTVHASSASDALTRLETLVQFYSGIEIPLRSLRKQICDAVDLIIQVNKTGSGRRYIEEVLELTGMESDVVTRQPLFKQAGDKGQTKLIANGQPPGFLKRLEERGATLPKDFFSPSAYEN